MKAKPVAAIDIGGTLEETWGAKRTWFQENGIDIGTRPLDRNAVTSLLGVDQEMYDAMRALVYSPLQILSHELVVGSKHALKILAKSYRIFLLSSREQKFSEVTKDWLRSKEILELIDDIIFLGNQGNKFEWCKANDIWLMIDDDSRHLDVNDVTGPTIRIHLTSSAKETSNSSLLVCAAASWEEILDIVQMPHHSCANLRIAKTCTSAQSPI